MLEKKYIECEKHKINFLITDEVTMFKKKNKKVCKITKSKK